MTLSGKPSRSGDESLLAAVRRARERKDVGWLIGALRDTEVSVRRRAAASLGELRAEEAVRPLIRLLQSNDFGTRVVVTRALGKIGDPSAIPALREIAEGNDPPGLQATAMTALMRLGDDQLGPVVARLLVDPNLGTRLRATPAPVKGWTWYLRRWARQTLLDLRDAKAVPILEDAIPSAPLQRKLQLKMLVRRLR